MNRSIKSSSVGGEENDPRQKREIMLPADMKKPAEASASQGTQEKSSKIAQKPSEKKYLRFRSPSTFSKGSESAKQTSRGLKAHDILKKSTGFKLKNPLYKQPKKPGDGILGSSFNRPLRKTDGDETLAQFKDEKGREVILLGKSESTETEKKKKMVCYCNHEEESPEPLIGNALDENASSGGEKKKCPSPNLQSKNRFVPFPKYSGAPRLQLPKKPVAPQQEVFVGDPYSGNEPSRITIPYAENVNFDQRIVMLPTAALPTTNHQTSELPEIVGSPRATQRKNCKKPATLGEDEGETVGASNPENELNSNHIKLQECIRLYGNLCAISNAQTTKEAEAELGVTQGVSEYTPASDETTNESVDPMRPTGDEIIGGPRETTPSNDLTTHAASEEQKDVTEAIVGEPEPAIITQPDETFNDSTPETTDEDNTRGESESSNGKIDNCIMIKITSPNGFIFTEVTTESAIVGQKAPGEEETPNQESVTEDVAKANNLEEANLSKSTIETTEDSDEQDCIGN